jgi:hypothetical protein
MMPKSIPRFGPSPYRYTAIVRSCQLGMFVQAMVINLTPLLFIPLREEFGLTFEQIGRLVLINFITQMLVDLACAAAPRLPVKPLVVGANLAAVLGLLLFAWVPFHLAVPYHGLVLGTVAGWYLDDKLQIDWKYQLALYLVPTAIYALMFLGQTFPRSEAAESGASFVDMFRDVGILGAAVACFLLALFFGDILKNFIPEQAAVAGYAIGGALLLGVAVMTRFSIGSLLLFILFVTHALVGAVELGTDSWIQNITGNLFTSEQGKWLFIWTSVIMFGLRFCAHFIETRLGLSPIGILLASSILAFVGLRFASGMNTFPAALAALGIYAIGKTFFWPTMLAVVGDRFPQTGAVAMSIMGGIGMLSAGLLGGPGLGYCKDRFAGEALQRADTAIYEQYRSETPSRFLNLPATDAFGLDGSKLAAARKAGAEATAAQKAAILADQQGDRDTLNVDAFIPATMAVIYLGLLVYFAASGGYKRVEMRR